MAVKRTITDPVAAFDKVGRLIDAAIDEAHAVHQATEYQEMAHVLNRLQSARTIVDRTLAPPIAPDAEEGDE